MHRLPRLPGPIWCVPLIILALVLLQRAGTRWLIAAVAATLWTAFVAQRQLDDRLPAELTRHDFDVSGWVDGFPTGDPQRKTFSFRVEQAADPAVPRRLRLSWYDAPPELTAGATLSLTVRLRAPHGLLNPGGFDYEQWLLVQGYGATGYVRAGAAAPAARFDLARWWLGARRHVAETLSASAPDSAAAALLTALAIGERYGFTDEQWSDLRRSGTSHLVAISGMHAGLLAMLVFFLVRRLWLRLPAGASVYDLEAAAVASVLAAFWYAALAGFALPTQRSLVMIVAALTVAASRRSVGAANGLAAALIAVLAWDPFAVLSASFWMSFAAVALLLVLASRREVHVRRLGRAERIRRGAAAIVSLQCSISFGLVPIVVLFFGQFSVVSPLVNFVAIPYFNVLLVPLTLIAVLVSYLHVAGASMFVYGVGWLANLAWSAIHWTAGWPWSAIDLAEPALPVALLAIVGVLAGLPAHPLPGRALAWCALLPLLLPCQPRLPAGSARVTLLDVGHGLALVVATSSHRLLYDAGPSFPSGYDSGKQIVVPALSQRYRAGLDLLIVSHADNDHAGGAAAVLEAFPEADVLKGPDVTAIPGRTCERGQRWVWDGVSFEVLHPPAGFDELGNESSCVLKVTTAYGSLLVTGDAEDRAERLLAARRDIAADVVVVGHHGSATSSTAGFVQAVHAKLALVSAGHANQWGFPRPEVTRRWQATGASIRVTGDAGALTVSFDERGISLAAERYRRHRYWRTEPPPLSGASDPAAL